ncbi:MAG: PQQ-dependent sugar dehydrogenase [Bdellovibrionales bacterium]|nr:PQQ-dependent sugar dehydrogenase [Bdellovibrionales bacterium]
MSRAQITKVLKICYDLFKLNYMNKVIFLFILLFYSTNSFSVEAVKVYQGKNVIWGFDFINKNEILFTERTGNLFYYNFKTKVLKKLLAPDAHIDGQGGLLDILIDKDTVFLTFSKKNKDTITTALTRAKLRNKSIHDMQVIFEAKVKSNTTRHFGSRLVLKDNLIYMTIGDRGERDYAQDLSVHNGSIIRITKEGKTPAGNPFIDNEKALSEIWSYGHRNPQGIDIHPITKEIYSCEFGPRGGDELNLIKKGVNYGWPIITYGSEYWGPKIGTTHKEGMEQPLKYWVPSISPSGMVFYRGDKIKGWKNNLFLANLSSTHLRRLVLEKNNVVEEESLFKDLKERVRQVRNSPDGYLYFSTDSGRIYKITP